MEQETNNVNVQNNGETVTTTIENPAMPEIGEVNTAPNTDPQTDTTEQANDLQNQVNTFNQNEIEIAQDLKAKGLDFEVFADEYDRYGELSKASLDALEKAGYPKAFINSYINGLEAISEKFVNTVVGMAGGQEQYSQVIAYLQSQPKAVARAFNETIETGNLGQIKLALDGIMSQMRATYGTANATLMGGQRGYGVNTGYTNTDEMVKDMSDPRYQKDPVFTRQVYNKIQNAKFY